jgi:hypothetical protein
MPRLGRGPAAPAALALLGLLALVPAIARDTGAGRVMPPEALTCPRDQLTLYHGAVTAYRREPGRTVLRIRTDWATTESVRLAHPGSDDPSGRFLIDGAPFVAADWSRIETAPGRLRSPMRAAAWVCGDGLTPPLVDWQPPRAP